MSIPARILRAEIDALGAGRPSLSPREQDQQQRVLAAAAHMMAVHGRGGVTLTSLARALGMSPATIKRLFCDIDSILAEILSRHLQEIAAKFGELPSDSGNPQAARRAAYLALTRTGFGGPTERHLLLIRDRHALPPDLAEPLEALRQSVGDMLGYPNGAAALSLLDNQGLLGTEIETMLAVLAPEPAAAQPALPGQSSCQAKAAPKRKAKAGPALPALPARARQTDGASELDDEKMLRDIPARRSRFLN